MDSLLFRLRIIQENLIFQYIKSIVKEATKEAKNFCSSIILFHSLKTKKSNCIFS